MTQHILSVAIPRPLDGLFTYRLPEEWVDKVQVGGWVRVPFGKTVTHAFVVEPPRPLSEIPAGVPAAKLRDIIEIGAEGAVFTEEILALCKWAHEYYLAPLGEILHCAASPAALGLKTKGKEARALAGPGPEALTAREVQLTPQQTEAFETLEKLRGSGAPVKVGVLNGVTGSGKTEIYIELAKRALAENKSVVLLVPEIALTSQLRDRLEAGLGTAVGLWHSAVADGRRRDLGAAVRSGEVRVLVGARSAVFAPVRDLGLLIIDEEHDPSYKQEERVRYHARDLAVVRAKLTGATVILGSATPSLETRERVREGRYVCAHLPSRAIGAELPSIECVDLCEEERVEGIQAPLAKKTVDAIRETIAAGDQAMVFLNRRGFAAFLVCQDCGEVNDCPNCSISLTVHKSAVTLRCHVCGHQEPMPDFCRKCQGRELEPVGAGTESLEAELPKLIPEMKVARLDRDQITSVSRLEKVLEDFRTGKSNVLLGTQMLVKGHDFPGVTLVVVVMADALFRWPDFRATERAYQILRQVSGRAGRRERPGRVLIQAFDTDHAVLRVLRGELAEQSFLDEERALRKALRYPPFGRLARVRFESMERHEAAAGAAEAVAAAREASDDESVEIMGPSEAFLERAKGLYRWDILLRSGEIQGLQRKLRRIREVSGAKKRQFSIDVDPYGVG